MKSKTLSSIRDKKLFGTAPRFYQEPTLPKPKKKISNYDNNRIKLDNEDIPTTLSRPIESTKKNGRTQTTTKILTTKSRNASNNIYIKGNNHLEEQLNTHNEYNDHHKDHNNDNNDNKDHNNNNECDININED